MAALLPSYAGGGGPPWGATLSAVTAGGVLTWAPARDRLDLLADSVAAAVAVVPSARAAAIDPSLADTAAFCAAYGVPLKNSANCVVVAGKRSGETRYAAVIVLATDRADVNGVVRRQLDVRKISFAPMAEAVAATGMEYGGITPIGLPEGWPILIDSAVLAAGEVVVGSGRRASKILLAARDLLLLPDAAELALAR